MPGAVTVTIPRVMIVELNPLDQPTRSETSSVWPSSKCPVAVYDVEPVRPPPGAVVSSTDCDGGETSIDVSPLIGGVTTVPPEPPLPGGGAFFTPAQPKDRVLSAAPARTDKAKVVRRGAFIDSAPTRGLFATNRAAGGRSKKRSFTNIVGIYPQSGHLIRFFPAAQPAENDRDLAVVLA